MFFNTQILPRLAQETVRVKLPLRWIATRKFLQKVSRRRNVPTVVEVLHFSTNSQFDHLAQCPQFHLEIAIRRLHGALAAEDEIAVIRAILNDVRVEVNQHLFIS